MKTALFLLRPYRRFIIIMMVGCLGYSLIAGLEGKLNPVALVGVPFFITVLITVRIRLLDSPFPLSDRQLAWIPMSMWALAMLASLLVTGVAVALSSEPVIAPMSQLVSQWLLCVLIACYLWRFGENIVYGLPSSLVLWPKSWSLSSIVVDLAPLMLMVIIYLVWEAPLQVSQWRRKDFTGQNYFGSRQVDFASPVRPILWVSLTNSIAYGVALAMGGYLVWFYYIMNPDQRIFAGRGYFFNLLFLVALLAMLVALLWSAWRRVRGNGFTGFGFVWRWLLSISLVGQPFLPYTGVKSGAVRRCHLCRNDRLAWMQQCPHCSRNDVSEKVAKKKSVWRYDYMARDSMATSYRFMIPIMLILLACISLARQWAQ